MLFHLLVFLCLLNQSIFDATILLITSFGIVHYYIDSEIHHLTGIFIYH
jgi:hypothetical protein